MAKVVRLITGQPSLATPACQTRAISPGTARLRKACVGSGLTQLELGRLIGTDDRGVRARLKERARADRLDLLDAVEVYVAGRKAA